MKQSNLPARVRINRDLPGAFPERAGDACESQVVECCPPPGTDGNHMIDMECRLLRGLCESTYSQRSAPVA